MVTFLFLLSPFSIASSEFSGMDAFDLGLSSAVELAVTDCTPGWVTFRVGVCPFGVECGDVAKRERDRLAKPFSSSLAAALFSLVSSG